jgi:hypothetical protein
MAIAVVGGLFMSTLLTLVVVPVVFTYMDDLQHWILKVFHHADAAADRAQQRNVTPHPEVPADEAEMLSGRM